MKLGRKSSFKKPNIAGESLIQLLLPLDRREQWNHIYSSLFRCLWHLGVWDGHHFNKPSNLCTPQVQCLHRTRISTSEWYTCRKQTHQSLLRCFTNSPMPQGWSHNSRLLNANWIVPESSRSYNISCIRIQRGKERRNKFLLKNMHQAETINSQPWDFHFSSWTKLLKLLQEDY